MRRDGPTEGSVAKGIKCQTRQCDMKNSIFLAEAVKLRATSAKRSHGSQGKTKKNTCGEIAKRRNHVTLTRKAARQVASRGC